MTTATIETLPTAYTEDINKFFRRGCPKKRDTLMKQMKESLLAKRINYNQLFPNKSLRKDVLGHILLLTSVSGVVAISGEKLAKNVGCSVDYVYRSMSNIKKTGEIIVTGLADGSNKYVFVLKSHPNFSRILKDVFFMDIPEPSTEQSTEPKNAENVDMAGLNDEKTGSQSLQSFISKHERDIIKQSIENEVFSIQNDKEKEAEYISTYYVSEYQKMVYDYIHNENNDFHDSIKDSAVIVGLRAGSNCNQKQYVKAIQTLIKIDSFIKRDGVVRESIPALFTMMYKHGLKLWEYVRQYKLQNPPQATTRRVKPVPFYNWLVERD